MAAEFIAARSQSGRMQQKCMRCSADLTGDEIALYRKMVVRGASQFLCLDCLAKECSATRNDLEELIDYFHKTGVCSLFVKDSEGN